MTPPRPREVIKQDLETARAYQARTSLRPSSDPLVHLMRSANDREIEDLEGELALVDSGELELRFAGSAFDQHKMPVPVVSRILETLQSTFRAAYRCVSPGGHAGRAEATLTLAGTAPGSFRLFLTTPPVQLDVLAPPLADQAMGGIVALLEAASHGDAGQVGPRWAEETDEAYVRSMIRLASTLAGIHAETSLRWFPADQTERIIHLASEQALALAIALAGETGREILTVTGHLEMAQDNPPKVRIKTSDDQFLAKVPDDLLNQVKDLIFEEVQATLSIDMKTSPTTGKPETDTELLDIAQAS